MTDILKPAEWDRGLNALDALINAATDRDRRKKIRRVVERKAAERQANGGVLR